MSYAVTDAGEQDMRAELKVLEELNDDIDQLAARARDCDTVAPELKRALDLAWYIAEQSMRECGRSSCGHIEIQRNPYCACCYHFAQIQGWAQILRSRL